MVNVSRQLVPFAAFHSEAQWNSYPCCTYILAEGHYAADAGMRQSSLLLAPHDGSSHAMLMEPVV